MMAVQCSKFGEPTVLNYVEVEKPQPLSGKVLIKVLAASVNFSDLIRRENRPYPIPTFLPYIPGNEVAGIIEEVGTGVDANRVGTTVFALVQSEKNFASTGYSQYVIADRNLAYPVPAGLDLDKASGIFIAACTAAVMLREGAQLKKGETVLVGAAAGGVGSLLTGAVDIHVITMPLEKAAEDTDR